MACFPSPQEVFFLVSQSVSCRRRHRDLITHCVCQPHSFARPLVISSTGCVVQGRAKRDYGWVRHSVPFLVAAKPSNSRKGKVSASFSLRFMEVPYLNLLPTNNFLCIWLKTLQTNMVVEAINLQSEVRADFRGCIDLNSKNLHQFSKNPQKIAKKSNSPFPSVSAATLCGPNLAWPNIR